MFDTWGATFSFSYFGRLPIEEYDKVMVGVRSCGFPCMWISMDGRMEVLAAVGYRSVRSLCVAATRVMLLM